MLNFLHVLTYSILQPCLNALPQEPFVPPKQNVISTNTHDPMAASTMHYILIH